MISVTRGRAGLRATALCDEPGCGNVSDVEVATVERGASLLRGPYVEAKCHVPDGWSTSGERDIYGDLMLRCPEHASMVTITVRTG